MTDKEALKIVCLRVENVKRVRAVTIRPGDGSTVIVGGKNAQGKTSVLDAIEMAIGGGKTLPEEPIRRGAKKAVIIADLGDLVVERVITATGSTLTVRDRDGTKLSSPQTLLDKLCSRISFDPLEFSRMDPPKQNELLRKLAGLDFTALDQKREALYAKRTEVGKDAKRSRAYSVAIQIPPSTPTATVDVEALLAQLSAATKAESAANDRAWKLGEAQKAFDATERDVTAAKAELARAEQKRMGARLALKTIEREQAEAAAAAVPAIDADALNLQIKGATETNRNVQRRAERDQHESRAGELEAEALALTEQITALDEQKHLALSQAAYPVPGIALGNEGPLFNGVPLEQASGAEKLRVSVAIGLALNPRLKVLLIRDASLLDTNGMQLVTEMAEAAGAQVWLERVGTGDPSAVVILDGQVDESAVPANAVEREAV